MFYVVVLKSFRVLEFFIGFFVFGLLLREIIGSVEKCIGGLGLSLDMTYDFCLKFSYMVYLIVKEGRKYNFFKCLGRKWDGD